MASSRRFAAVTDRLADLGSSAKWALHIRARELASSREIIELTIGEPDVTVERKLIDECTRSMLSGRTRYAPGRGEDTVLDALVEKYSSRAPHVTQRNFLWFPGTQTALYAAVMGLAGPGDHVLVGDPYYATYAGVIAATGAERISVPLSSSNGYRMRAKDLEERITPESRAVLLNSPHNPTGSVLTVEDVVAISEVCEKHNLWMVCDEVYEHLVFDEECKFASPLDFPQFFDRTVAVSSISKSHAAPGFRSGWCVGPEDLCDRLLPLSDTILFGGQPFVADMTALALSEPYDTAALMRNIYRRRASLVVDALEGDSAPGVVPVAPLAGMFVVLDVSRTGLSGNSFAWTLLESESVAVMPGDSFGDEADHLVRISLTVPDELLATACERITRFARSLVGGGREGNTAAAAL